MAHDAEVIELRELTAGANESALAALFSKYRANLEQAVRIRLDRRMQSREGGSDILQESYLVAAKDLPRYVQDPKVSPYVWLRGIVQQRLIDAHRRHGCAKRDAKREVSLHRGSMPQADSFSIASKLLGDLPSPSDAVLRTEARVILQTALNRMDPIDREIIAMRHFEGLKSVEVARVLELDESTASTRYLRALKKLKNALSEHPEIFPAE